MGSLFTQLFKFLSDLLFSFLRFLYNALIELINAIIYGVSLLFSSLLSLLPTLDVPSSAPSALTDIAQKVAWFIPLSTMHSCLLILGVAFLAYFTVKPILKFVRLT
jgi:hypothetical protein